jgi:hypothetical protein
MTFLSFLQTYYPCGKQHIWPSLAFDKYCKQLIYYIYMLYRQMYTVLCYLTQFLLNVAQHVSSLYKAHLQGLFR